MHPAIQQLALRLGTQIVDRDAKVGGIYDGSTIASHYRVWPDQEDLWRGEKPQLVYYSNALFLHELGHYVAASPEQRKLPDYGLGLKLLVVSQDESDTQEYLAQLLSIYWGQKLDIALDVVCSPHNWESYLNKIVSKRYSELNLQQIWSAMIRFRELVDSGKV